MSDAHGNGQQSTELPENYEAVVRQQVVQYNQLASRLKDLEDENRDLKTRIAGYKVAMEAGDTRLADLESRLNTAIVERDKAVADRTKYEAMFVSIKAQLRAFAVPNAPLIRDASEKDVEELERENEDTRRRLAAQRQIQGINPYFQHLQPGEANIADTSTPDKIQQEQD